MAHYYVNDNAQSNGDHEVHKEGCYWLGLVKSRTYLGLFNSCDGAVRKAKCTAPGSLDTRLRYAAWRSSCSSRASIGV